MYILKYTKEFQNEYFVGQNTYLGIADTTHDIEEARHLTFEEAKKFLNLMSEKDKWEIWSIRKGTILDRKIYDDTIRQKREELLKQRTWF